MLLILMYLRKNINNINKEKKYNGYIIIWTTGGLLPRNYSKDNIKYGHWYVIVGNEACPECILCLMIADNNNYIRIVRINKKNLVHDICSFLVMFKIMW